MELIFMHIEKYRVFSKQDISFSSNFVVEFDSLHNTISIKRGKASARIYPENITNVNAIVGKNGVGKTSIMDLLAEKVSFRTKHKDESYFIIYYYGQDGGGEDRFIFETPNVKEYESLFSHIPDIGYYISKQWGMFLCRNVGDRLSIDKNNDTIVGHLSAEYSMIRLLDRNESKRPFNNVVVRDEDSRLAVKRRTYSISKYRVYDTINMLIDLMKIPNRDMFNDSQYSLNISFDSCELWTSFAIDNDGGEYKPNYLIPEFKSSAFEEWSDWQIVLCDFLYRYCMHFLSNAIMKGHLNIDDYEDASRLKTVLGWYEKKKIGAESAGDYSQWKKCFIDRICVLFDYYNKREGKGLELKIGKIHKAIEQFELFLCHASDRKIEWNRSSQGIKIEFSKDSILSEQKAFFYAVLDEEILSNEDNSDYSVMSGFLRAKIEYLSDGEEAFLSFLSSLHLALNDESFAFKSDYLILCDEVEKSLHPDFCRRFLSVLVKYLARYSDKNFQLIIATHSPFIIGDVLGENLVLLKRTEANSEIEKPTVQSFGQNIHMMLKRPFFMDNTLGEYAVEYIRALSFVLNSKSDEDYLARLSSEKGKILPINHSENIYMQLSNMIDLIGEEVIREELKMQLHKSIFYSKPNEIAYLHQRLKELEKRQDD